MRLKVVIYAYYAHESLSAQTKKGRTVTRSSQRRRRRRRWRGIKVEPIDRMHQWLGLLLTEMGRVEFQMLLLANLLNDAPIEYLFDEFSEKPFGPKIDSFKKWCDFGGVPDKFRKRLEAIYADLPKLREKRNLLVHGETWEGVLAGSSRQPYRVGVVKENLEYLEELERGERGPHVFDIHQVRDVVSFAARLRNDLQLLRNDILRG